MQEDPVLYPTHRSYWKIDQVMNHMPLSTNNAGSDVPELNVSCKIDELAASAISRAKTASCKQHLADVACRIYKDILFPKKLPRFCPSKGKVTTDTNEGVSIGILCCLCAKSKCI